MNLNPHTFARHVRELKQFGPLDADPTLLWLPTDTIDRIADGLDADAFEFPDEPMPSNGVVIGTAVPVETTISDSLNVIHIQSDASVRDGFIDSLIHHNPELCKERIERFCASKGRVVPVYGHDEGDTRLSAMTLVDPNTWTVFPELADPNPKSFVSMVIAATAKNAKPGEHTLLDFVRAAWTLATSDEERDVHAIARRNKSVNVGKSGRGRRRVDVEVSVLDIKRPKVPHGGDRNTEGGAFSYSHRFEVRGHYRMQACGPGRSQRRKRWIDGFVKGPDDKPLIRKTKVYRVR